MEYGVDMIRLLSAGRHSFGFILQVVFQYKPF